METIPKFDCTQVGFFRKTHGVRGELVLEYEPEFDLSVEESDRFFVEIEGLLVPFFVSGAGVRIKSPKSAIVKFDWVDAEDNARHLVGRTAWLFNDEIIHEEEEMTVSMFAGFVLEDVNLGEIGPVSSVDDFSGNLVLNVDYKGNEVLIPFNEDFLVLVDNEKKILRLELPAGLLDV